MYTSSSHRYHGNGLNVGTRSYLCASVKFGFNRTLRSQESAYKLPYIKQMSNGPETMTPIHHTPSHIITPDSLIPTSPYTDQKVGWWAGVPVATDPITDTDKHGPNHSITSSKRSRPLGEADPTVTNHHRKYIYIYIIFGTTITGPGTGERIYPVARVEQNRYVWDS